MTATEPANRRLFFFGGLALILSGILDLARCGFLLPIPDPPLTEGGWAAWTERWTFHFSMADELLFFAAVPIIPAVFALYRRFAEQTPLAALFGSGLLALTVPVQMLSVVLLGRLVYPVYGLQLSEENLRLTFSLYAGTQHALLLIVAIAAACFGIAVLRGRPEPLRRTTAGIGFAASALSVIGSYPWLIGGAGAFFTQSAVAAWWVALGIFLLLPARNPHS